MAYDTVVAKRIRRVLSNQPEVREVKMMGGLIFMVNGHMCCGASGSDLMVRVGPDAYEKALADANTLPLDIGDGRTPRAFICVSTAGFSTEAALYRWVQKGLDFVNALPPKPPQKDKK